MNIHIEYDFLFHVLELPEQIKTKCHLKDYVLLAHVSLYIISSILSHCKNSDSSGATFACLLRLL